MSKWYQRVMAAAGMVGFGMMSVALGVAPSACSSAPPPEVPEPCDTQVVTVNIYAMDDINPNEKELPRPVVVRLYQLANDVRMLNAGYDDVLLKDAEVLKDDLLKVDEVTIYPNDLVEVKFERIPTAGYLCGAAMFRNPQGQSWKTFYTFPPMPNAPAACGAAAAEAGMDAEEPQAFPRTAFFLAENRIDNGSQYDESMFTSSTPIKKISLPKRSATSDSYAGGPGSKK